MLDSTKVTSTRSVAVAKFTTKVRVALAITIYSRRDFHMH